MITSVSCSACGRAQNAPSSRAGQEVACRFCGDSIQVPGSPQPQSAIGGWRNVGPADEASPPPAPQEPGAARSRGQGRSQPSSPLGLFGRLAAVASGTSSESESVYRASSQTEYLPGGEVRTTRSESARGSEGEAYEARYESVRGPEGQLSESSHESGTRPELAREFGGAAVFDRAHHRPADEGPQGTGAPLGTPVTTSRLAREAKAGRPIVSGPAGAKVHTPFELFLPTLTSDSQAEKTAAIAVVLAVVGWAFCFPISIGALYFAAQSKKHALAEGVEVPKLATIANVAAILNLALVFLASLGNLS